MRTLVRMKKFGNSGFTLIEAIVSIAVFAVAAVMIAMILFTATNMVHFSLLYDSDRAKLMEAAAKGPNAVSGEIEVSVIGAGDQRYEKFTLVLDGSNTLRISGDYFVYKVASTGREYYLFMPDSGDYNDSATP